MNIIVNSFDQLERIGWKHKQIATFLLEVNIEQFFDETVIPDDQNIIIYVLNHSESEFYSLLIKEVYLCNDSLITKLFIDWLDEKFNSFSELGIYTLAYCISQLLFIDKTWTQETVFKRLSQIENKELYALCMCCNFGYVYQNVISFITSNRLFEKIAGLIKTEEPNADNAFSYINYIIAGYYFGFMDESDLHSFIQSLPEEHVNHLIWSCIGGIKGGSFDQQKELLKTIYYIYCKTHSDNAIHMALIKNISRFSYLDEDCWELVYEALQNIQTKKNIWEDVRDCLERTVTKIYTIIVVVKYLMDSGKVPDVYTIKNIMFISQNIGMPDLVKDIARYAMDHCILHSRDSTLGMSL